MQTIGPLSCLYFLMVLPTKKAGPNLSSLTDLSSLLKCKMFWQK